MLHYFLSISMVNLTCSPLPVPMCAGGDRTVDSLLGCQVIALATAFQGREEAS
jgi:hypothetical protein